MTILRNRDHSRSLGEGLWMMYQAGYLLDIEVHLHGKTTKAHRLVLAALSPVLRPSLMPLGAINSDSSVALDLSTAVEHANISVPLRSINLDEVVDGPLDLDTLLEFVYRGEVTLSGERAAGLPNLLKTAEVLKIECLVQEEDQDEEQRMPTGEVEQITITVEQQLMASYGAVADPPATAAEQGDNPPLSQQPMKRRRNARRNAKEKSANKTEQGNGEEDDDDEDAAPSFWCPHCCELFSDPTVYSDHMAKQHPSTSTDEQTSSSTSRTRNKRRVNYREVSENSIAGKTRSKSKSGSKKSKNAPSNDKCESKCDSLDQVRLSCPMCDFWTAHNWRLIKHLAAIHKVYENGRPLAKEQCSFCDYACVTAALLKRHVKCKHSANRPYKCLECDFSAAIRSDLDRHKTAKHCTERRFQCLFCGYKSKTKNAHDRHSRTHAKTILTCKTCGLWYTSDGYRRHVKSHVVTDNDGLNSSVVVKCHLCDQLMSISDTIESNMRSHLIEVHAVDVDKKNAQIERCNRAKMIPPISQMMNADGSLVEQEIHESGQEINQLAE